MHRRPAADLTAGGPIFGAMHAVDRRVLGTAQCSSAGSTYLKVDVPGPDNINA